MEKIEESSFNHLLCHACLCVGRYVYNIANENLLRYYRDALDEIPLSNIKHLTNITVCWECKALLQKCWSFREQVKDCYRILLAYTKENLNECLLTDVSRPPHLQRYNLLNIDIVPTDLADGHTDDIVKDECTNIKSENLQSVRDRSNRNSKSIRNSLENYRLSETFVKEYLSEPLENDEEILKTELETVLCPINKEKKELKRNSIEIESLSDSENHYLDTFEEDLKIELELETVICPIESENKEEKRVSLDIECPLDSEKNNDRGDSKTELKTFVCPMKKGKSQKLKVKKCKNKSKNLKVKKPKPKKIDLKVATIELSYEEMLAEREKESKRDSYLEAKFKCETCIIGFQYKRTYEAHLSGKHDPDFGEYICPICKVIVASVDSITAHYKKHVRRYECMVCQKRSSELQTIQHHCYTEHEISLKDYTCNICGKVSNSLDTHRYHKDTHKVRVQCPDCDKTFRHRAGLLNHRLTVHESKNTFPCSVCGKVFRWKTSLKRHLLTHETKNDCSSETPPYCSTCNISFSSLCSFQRHMRNSLKHVTQDQLRFICEHCKRRFSDKTKLRDHIEEKHLHKTYRCHICHKPSKNRVGLDQHIRNVHKGRPKNKICHHCGRGFPTKMQLESHIRTHTGERPYICEYCPTTFSQQSNLYKHNRQVHLNIKTKRYPISKKKKEDGPDPIKEPVFDNQPVIEEPYRPIVLQYSPERGFVL